MAKAITQFVHINDLRNHFFPAYEKITDQELYWKTEGYNNDIAFLLRHIAQAEDWFLHAVIHQKHDFTPKRKSELPTIKELLAYLHETRNNTIAFLEENEISILQETRTMPDGFRGKKVDNPTIEWIMKRVFDHEVYHLAQVNLMLRLQGIDPPNM